MARTIDEKIVQMTFNNDKFEKNAKDTISTLDKLKESLDFTKSVGSFNSLEKTAKGLDLSSITIATSKISEGFSYLEEIAVGALRRIGQMAVDTGTKLIKNLTVDQLAAGWSKYVDLTGSVQTLVNSTGKGTEEIDKYLERLMWYSDETSFGFTDMTKALGTMVSSGGEIDKLIPMLMGVGNATAYAGKGASEFSRVIYNLNQSYSSGFLNTMDWKSIELAGVDSKMLKEQLMAAAVELGTINKESAKLENFRQLLSDKVFTRDVMEKAFGRFADFTLEVEKAVAAGTYETASEAMEALAGNYEKFQEDAFTAAQSAKSFKEAIEATQDAVSSGWMQSYKLIFGNYDESKALWTDVTGSLWDWFASGAESRNKVLKEWKNIWTSAVEAKNAYDSLDDKKKQFIELDGFYENLDDSLTQTQALWRAFSSVVDSIREYLSSIWEEVFPTPDIKEIAQTIFDFVEKIRSGLNLLADAFGPNESNTVFNIGRALEGILKVFRAIIKISGEFSKSFIQPLAKRIKPIIEDIIEIFGNLGDILSSISDDAISDFSPLQKILGGILDILDPIINVIGSIVKWVKELTSQNKEITIFSGLFETIGNVFESIGKAIKGTANLFSDLSKSLGTIFDKLKDTIGNLLSSHGSDVAGLAEGGFLGVLAYGMTKAIGKLKNLDLDNVITSIFNFFKGEKTNLIDKIKETFNTLTESLNKFSEAIKVKMLNEIGTALIKLAGSLLIISLIDGDKIASSLGAMALILGESLAFMSLVDSLDTKKAIKGSIALNIIGTAMLELAVALKIMSTLDPAGMVNSLVAMGVVLLELGLFFKALSAMEGDPKTIKSISKTMSSLGFAMIEIAAALKIMSTIDGNQMVVALGGLSVSLLAVGTFIVAINKFTKDAGPAKIAAISASLTLMGLGLIELAAALKIMSTMSWESMAKGLLSLSGGLLAIGLFVAGMQAFGGGGLGLIAVGAGLTILSGGLIVLAGALYLMGSMSWETIGKGLATIAGSLLVIGGLGALLGIVSPALLIFSLALATFGIALGAVAEGIIKFVGAYALFSAVGEDLSQNLMTIFEEAFATIIELIPSLILGIVKAVLNLAGELVALIGQLIDIVLTALIQNVPKLISGGFTLLLSILKGIRDNIYNVITVSAEIILELTKGLIDNLPLLIDAGFKLLISFINGLADAITNNAGEFGTAVGNLAGAIITGIIDALLSAVSSFGEKIGSFGKKLLTGIADWFNGSETKEETKGVGEEIVGSISNSMDDKKAELESQSENLGSSAIESLTRGVESGKDNLLRSVDVMMTDTTNNMDASSEAESSGVNTLSGLYTGLTNPGWISKIRGAGSSAASAFKEGYDSTMDQHSPSREMERTGRFTVLGLINGLKETGGIEETAKNVGSLIINSIQNAIDAANSILDDDMSPIITPVLDLTNIEANAGTISDIMNSHNSLLAAQRISGTMRSISSNSDYYGAQQSNNQNGETQGVTFVQNNYSPKALSAIDIYRQTRNQFSAMKGWANTR